MSDALESQICAGCGATFYAETRDPIPLCSDCKMEEEKTAFTGDPTQENTQTVKTPVMTASPGTGWRVKKSNGQVYGPFPHATITQWAKTGKIGPEEEISPASGQETWLPIAAVGSFKKLYATQTDSPGSALDAPKNQVEALPDLFSDTDVAQMVSSRPAPSPVASASRIPSEEETLTHESHLPPRSLDLDANVPLFKTKRHRKISFFASKKVFAALGALALVFLLFWGLSQVPGQIRKVKSWWEARYYEPDRVDVYISNYARELGELSGDSKAFASSGWQSFLKQTLGSLNEAERFFKSALVIDRANPLAMAGLAATYAELAALDQNTELFTIAYDLAFKAYALNADLPEGRLAIGLLLIRLNTRLDEVKKHLDFVRQGSPKNPLALSLLGQWHLLMAVNQTDPTAQLNQSVTHLKEALGQNQLREMTGFYLGRAYHDLFQFRQAERVWRKIRSPPEGTHIFEARARLAEGRMFFDIGDYAQARTAFAAALRLHPQWVDAVLHLNNLLIFYFNNPGEALGNLKAFLNEEKASLNEVENKKVVNLFALAQYHAGSKEEAQTNFHKIIQQDAYFRPATYNLALIHLKEGQDVEAMRYFDSLKGWTEKPLLYSYYRGRALEGFDDRFQEAVASYQKIYRGDANLPQGQIGMYRIFSKMGEERRAQDVLWRACLTQVDYLQSHHWLTPGVGGEDLDLTSVLNQQASRVKADPYSVERLAGYAYLLVVDQKLKTAKTILEKALVQDPQDVSVLVLYSHLLNRLGKFKKAAEILRRAYRSNPQNSAILKNLGRAYLGLRKYPLAENYLKSLTDSPEATAEGFYLYGRLMQARKDKPAARQAWIEALRRDPAYILPKKALYLLK